MLEAQNSQIEKAEWKVAEVDRLVRTVELGAFMSMRQYSFALSCIVVDFVM